MAGPTRLELATSCVTGRRSNRTELRPRELMLKNAHLRRQDLEFELQRTTQYASAQILSPSLHLGIFGRQPLDGYFLRYVPVNNKQPRQEHHNSKPAAVFTEFYVSDYRYFYDNQYKSGDPPNYRP